MATKAKQMVEDDDIFQNFEPIKFEEPKLKFKPYKVKKMSDEEFEAEFKKETGQSFSEAFDWI